MFFLISRPALFFLLLGFVVSFHRPIPQIHKSITCLCCSNARNTYAWDNFLRHQGTWAGLQISYNHEDADDVAVADFSLKLPNQLFCGVSLDCSVRSAVNHTNFFVSTSLNFDEMQQSVIASSIVQKHIAVYEKEGPPPLPMKVCGNCLLGGPGSSSKDSLSMQYSMVHLDERLRVLFRFEPSDFVKVPGTSIDIPNSMGIADLTIAREKRCPESIQDGGIVLLPPAEFVNPKSSQWREVNLKSDFQGEFEGLREVYTVGSDTIEKSLVPRFSLNVLERMEENQIALEKMLKSKDEVDEEEEEEEERANIGPYKEGDLVRVLGLSQNSQLNGIEGEINKVNSKDTEKLAPEKIEYTVTLRNGFAGNFLGANLEGFDDDIPRYFNAYRGGLLVDTPLIFLAGEETSVSAFWRIKDGNLYKASAVFTAMDDAVLKDGKIQGRRKKGVVGSQQPNLIRFEVETLKPVYPV